MPRKLKANAFSDEVCKWLNARTRFGNNVRWSANYRLDPSGRDYVDCAGLSKTRKKPLILIEIELHREDPVSNVVKIFKWAQDRRQQNLIMFHAFSRLYRLRKAERKNRALWLGQIFEKQCASRYVPLNLKFSPRPGGRFGGGARKKAAELLARRIMEHMLRMNSIPHK